MTVYTIDGITIVAESTKGAMDAEYKAYTVDNVALGSGNTKREAILDLCATLRFTADRIEIDLMNHEF